MQTPHTCRVSLSLEHAPIGPLEAPVNRAETVCIRVVHVNSTPADLKAKIDALQRLCFQELSIHVETK